MREGSRLGRVVSLVTEMRFCMKGCAWHGGEATRRAEISVSSPPSWLFSSLSCFWLLCRIVRPGYALLCCPSCMMSASALLIALVVPVRMRRGGKG